MAKSNHPEDVSALRLTIGFQRFGGVDGVRIVVDNHVFLFGHDELLPRDGGRAEEVLPAAQHAQR